MSSITLVAPGPDLSRNPRYALLPHVLLVLDGIPKALGGGERIALRMASLLPAYGYRVSILTFSLHPESSFQPEDAPCPVFLLPLTRTYDFAAFRAAIDLGRFLHTQKVRIVQTFFESSDIWGGLVTRALSDAKLVWSRRDMGILRGRKHSVAYRLMRRLPHAVFAVSNGVARHVIEVDGVPGERVQTIYNGLDLEHIPTSTDAASERPAIITTIGNIRRVKGHDLLLRAAATVLRTYPEAMFTIAGEVLEEDFFLELQKLARELGIEDRFRFLGKITDLPEHLGTASIFVLPSRSEGFSNALIEAMACGVPVIATDVGGNSEAVAHGVSGLIVPPEDHIALAAALLQLLSSPAELRQMSIAGRHRIQANFTAKAMMTRLSEAYTALLAS